MSGFGRYLLVDLSTGGSEQREIPRHVLRRRIGGAGLGVHLARELSPPDLDPLAPEAPVVFVFSPLVGTPLTTSAKFAVVAKSPLTGQLNDALSSSHFAIAGRMTGNEAIAIVGRAPEPSVCLIDSDGVRVLAAPDLWGLPAAEAEDVLRARFGGGYRAAAIGPAGEALVPFATVSHDGRHAGRGGHGAVLGSKNLKALAVRGREKVAVADPKRVLALAADLRERSFGPATEKYRELGTLANLLAFNALSTLPTRNFREATFEGAQELSAEQVSSLRERTRTHCASCTIGCGHIYPAANGGARMEYENAFALGPLCGVSDPDAVFAASARCDRLGIDTISAGEPSHSPWSASSGA